MKAPLGLNGFGRMNKLALWNYISRREPFVVVNLGRPVNMGNLVDFALFDGTYGSLKANLFGRFNERDVRVKVSSNRLVKIEDTEVVFLQEDRNPMDVRWADYGVEVVLDGTGKFNELDRDADHPDGSIRGHFEGGVKKVCLTSPLKEDAGVEDAVTVVQGVNFEDYDPLIHRIISNASCSTNALSVMVKPIVLEFGTESIVTMIVLIPHAATGKQPYLPRVPRTGKNDACTYHSVSGMYVSSTGVSENLKKVISGLDHVEFTARSVRVPLPSVSLACPIITLAVSENLTKGDLKDIYQKHGSEHLVWNDNPVSSVNVLGTRETVFADGYEMDVLPVKFPGAQGSQLVTPAWFDNEWGYAEREVELVENVRATA